MNGWVQMQGCVPLACCRQPLLRIYLLQVVIYVAFSTRFTGGAEDKAVCIHSSGRESS